MEFLEVVTYEQVKHIHKSAQSFAARKSIAETAPEYYDMHVYSHLKLVQDYSIHKNIAVVLFIDQSIGVFKKDHAAWDGRKIAYYDSIDKFIASCEEHYGEKIDLTID